MAQWGKTDNYQNSVIWAVAGFNKTANTGAGSNQQAFYNSVTPDAFITGETIGQFGVDTTEAGVGSANIAQVTITSAGTGYGATINSVITGGGGTGANVSFTSTVGKLTSSTINNGGSSYETNPTITIPAPPSTTFNANSAVTGGTGGGANSTIALSSAANFANNDAINYLVATGNTAVGGLTSGTKYYVQFANATVIALSTVPGGSRITLTKGFTETGHSFFGETAAASAVVGGASNKGVAHAGWVVRKVGSGGRAGRVQYETLVAMGTITSDGSDDTILPDS
jgi:hypothetical protein